MDNIVLWKRKAECYLMKCGVPYTIIHPGGLLPHFGASGKADGGRRQLYLGVNDDLLEVKSRSLIPREDVAEVCVKCLSCDEAIGRSFDLGSGPEEEGNHPIDVKQLIGSLEGKNCSYTESDAIFRPEKLGDARNACGILGVFCTR